MASDTLVQTLRAIFERQRNTTATHAISDSREPASSQNSSQDERGRAATQAEPLQGRGPGGT